MRELKLEAMYNVPVSGSLAMTPFTEVRYQIICSVAEEAEQAYFTYGIQCLGNCMGAWVQMDAIPDVSTNRDYVLRSVDRFNRLQLSPLHFRDVVVDSVNT